MCGILYARFLRIIKSPHIWVGSNRLTKFHNENCPTEGLIQEALVAAKKLSENTGDSFHYNQRKIQLEEAVQNCQNWREKIVNSIEESCGELTVNKMSVIFLFVVQTGFIFLGAKITGTNHFIFFPNDGAIVGYFRYFILVSRNIGRLFQGRK